MSATEPTPRLITLAALLVLVILGYVTWVGVRSNLNEVEETRWVDRTHRIITGLVGVRGALGERNALVRLYAGSGDARDLDRVRQIDEEIRETIRDVRVLSAAQEARDLLDELETALGGALRTDVTDAPGVTTARAQVLLARLLDLERQLLQTRADRLDVAARRTRSIVILGSALALLLALGSGLLLLNYLRERRQAHRALRTSEEQNRALINAIPDILMRVTAEGGIVTFKPPADVSDPEWVNAMEGRRIPDVLPPDVAIALVEGVNQSLREGSPQRVEFNMPMAHVRPGHDEVLDFEARFVPVREREVLVIARDISERKRMERLKNEFVSTVSHELRTPLTSIRGALSLIASGVLGELQPRGKKLVDIALSNSERLVRLINDILDIEKIESGKLEFRFQQIDLPELVARAIDDNRAYAQQFTVELERIDGTGAAHVRGDSDRLLQTLTNLISNAVKFSPKGETVTVATSRHDGRLRVTVRDRGPGIPKEFRSRIFQRFAQADSADTRQTGGTGLGLSISRAIVERHGGTIDFEDHPEGGTVFYFELPEMTPPPPIAVQTGARRRLLICEDDPDIAQLLGLILEKAGIASDVASSAEEAEQRLREGSYYALVLDLLLPGKDGISFIRQLRRQPETATLPIVVLSAVADQSRGVLAGDALSVVDWINKPVDSARLLSAVQLAAPNLNRPMRILHVDDDPDLREVVRELLGEAASALPVGSVAEARDALSRERFDLVLLDLGLPDGSGLELLPQLHESHPPVPVVVFSAREVDRESAELVAATLVKSRTTNDDLLDTIRALIDSARPPGETNGP